MLSLLSSALEGARNMVRLAGKRKRSREEGAAGGIILTDVAPPAAAVDTTHAEHPQISAAAAAEQLRKRQALGADFSTSGRSSSGVAWCCHGLNGAAAPLKTSATLLCPFGQ